VPLRTAHAAPRRRGRKVRRRALILVWLLPGLLALATVLLLVRSYDLTMNSVPVMGEVVRVDKQVYGAIYSDNDALLYVPLFRYPLPDGTSELATPGQAAPDWNFEIGTTMEIRYFPDRNADIVIPGIRNWYAPAMIGAVTVLLGAIALLYQRRRRRLARGTAS